MTTSQASEYTGLVASRLRQLVRSGALKAEKEETPRGPVLYFAKAELDRFTAERAREAEERRARKGKVGRPLKIKPEEPQA